MSHEPEPLDSPEDNELQHLLQSGYAALPPTAKYQAALLQQLDEEFARTHATKDLSPHSAATSPAMKDSAGIAGSAGSARPQRWIGLRLAVTMAAAASLLLAAALWNSQSAYGWASMLRALDECGWVQAVSSSSNLSGWVSSRRGIVALRREESATFQNRQEQTSLRYLSERDIVYKQSLPTNQPINQSSRQSEQLFRLLLSDDSEAASLQPLTMAKFEVAAETWRRIEPHGDQPAEIELRVTLLESGAERKLHKLLVLLDPETHLPRSCRLIAEERSASRSLDFAYPNDGPESLYSLGVPRETEVAASLATPRVPHESNASRALSTETLPAEAESAAKLAAVPQGETTNSPDKIVGAADGNPPAHAANQVDGSLSGAGLVDDHNREAEETLLEAQEIITVPREAEQTISPSAPRLASSAHSPQVELPALAIPAEPLAQQDLLARINEGLAASWEQQGIAAAQPASDTEFLRRVYLDLTGRIPIVSEVYRFLEDSAPDRREQLVDELLASRDHATHLATVWRKMLLPDGVDTGVYGGTNKFDEWLADRFEMNVPYDQLVRDLLLAEGRVSDSGPILFYAALKLNPEELAAKTARTFLGMRMECAQCHDDKFDDSLTQEDFWGFAAYFAQISRPQGKMEMTSSVLRVRDNQRGEVMLPDSDEVVPPRLPWAVPSSGVPASAEKSRREQLVDWLTTKQNGRFARATVNRVWQHLFGLGLVEPADDMRPDNPATCPEVLETLSLDFAASGYDLRRLLRALTLSDAYQLSSRSVSDEPSQALVFARMNIKSFSADQLYDCIQVAAEPKAQSNNRGEGALARFGNSPRASFIEQFQAPPGQRTDYQAGIPQALTLMHGRLVQGATDLSSSGKLKSLNAPFFSDEQRVETLFLSTLSRFPEPEEQSAMLAHLQTAEDDKARSQALGDILWALLNSAEFTFIH